MFSDVAGVPERFRGATKHNWTEALQDAARAGLLTSLGGRTYRVHPVLTGCLGAWWRSEDPESYEAMQEASTKALLAVYVAVGGRLTQQIRSGDASDALTIIRLECLTMGSLLGYALDRGLWDEAQAIAGPLDWYRKSLAQSSR